MAELRRVRPLLGCFVEIGVRDVSAHADRAITEAFGRIESIQKLLSFQDPNSELSRLNRSAGEEITLHPLAAHVLRLARGAMLATRGLFNCTVGGALVRRGVFANPGHEFIDVGAAEDLQMRGRRARLQRRVLITLDGIAKGYAVDHAIRSLQRAGIAAGWVNAGGDLRVFGDIAVPVHRREPDDRLVAFGELRRGAIATSCVSSCPDVRYPAWIVGDAARSPTTGVWSVLARKAWQADALTKVAALVPAASRDSTLARLGGRLLTAMEQA
jgi:thiamine biosynthesis lipoprotein